MYAGPLEGGDKSGWYSFATKAASIPKVGSKLRALPGSEFQGADGTTDYYEAGDLGAISKVTEDRISITWLRTGLTSSIGRLAWTRFFALLSDGPEVPQVGASLQALPGKPFH